MWQCTAGDWIMLGTNIFAREPCKHPLLPYHIHNLLRPTCLWLQTTLNSWLTYTNFETWEFLNSSDSLCWLILATDCESGIEGVWTCNGYLLLIHHTSNWNQRQEFPVCNNRYQIELNLFTSIFLDKCTYNPQ